MQRIAVIGLGAFGSHLARVLSRSGDEVIAIDSDARAVARIKDEVAVSVRLDATDRTALEAQGVNEVDAAIVGIGERFESVALVVATLKEMGVKRIIARAMTDIQGTILRKVGADELVAPEQESADRWAHRLSLSSLRQYVELGENHSLIYIPAPAAFWDKTLKQLDLRKKFKVNLVAVQREKPKKDDDEAAGGAMCGVVYVPAPETQILEGDVLMVVGSNQALSELPSD